MNRLRRGLRRIIGLLAGDEIMLAHAKRRYAANRRRGFVAHDKQQLERSKAVKLHKEGKLKQAQTAEDAAARLGRHAHLGHSRAQYWFREEKLLARRIGKLEWQRGKIMEKVDRALVMFDSVDVGQIPHNAPAVAGYVGGMWPTYDTLVKDWPHAQHLSIAIAASERARCLDVETGDATPYEAPGWVRGERHADSHHKPAVYSSVSAMQQIVDLVNAAGVHRNEILVLTAHYTNQPHICGPHSCGALAFDADGTQWTSAALGKNLDESRVRAGFFD